MAKLRSLAAPIAMLAIGGLVLTGCSRGGDAATGAENSNSELTVMTPAAVGDVDKVTWNNPYGEPASIDPIKGLNYPENLVTANLCDTLFQQQPDFSVEPSLAESYEVNDDLTSYVFKIREGVQFWDGSEMTVDDVVFSLKRNLDPNEASYWSTDMMNVTDIVATGDWEVTVSLKEPDAIFIDSLVTAAGAIVSQDFREKAGENFGNSDALIMCTGPFSVNEWKQGQSILLDRNDNYWNEDRTAKAAQVEIGFVVDPTAIGNGLATGEIQGSYDVPLPALGQLAASDEGTLYDGVGAQIMAIIATGNGAFGDPAVRRALTLATDRQAIADTVYEGTAVSAKSVVADTAWDIYPEAAALREELLPDLGYDLEAAKAELKNAKVDLSQPIKIVYPSERSFYADILNEMANGAKELGLTLEPTGVPSAQFGAFFSDPAAREGYDGFVTTNYPTSTEPIIYLGKIAGTGSDQNFSGFSDPAIDAAVAAARSESDPAKRAEFSVEAEALVMEQLPWIPVVGLNARLFMNNEVTGAPASFVYLNYPWAADLGAAE